MYALHDNIITQIVLNCPQGLVLFVGAWSRRWVQLPVVLLFFAGFTSRLKTTPPSTVLEYITSTIHWWMRCLQWVRTGHTSPKIEKINMWQFMLMLWEMVDSSWTLIWCFCRMSRHLIMSHCKAGQLLYKRDTQSVSSYKTVSFTWFKWQKIICSVNQFIFPFLANFCWWIWQIALHFHHLCNTSSDWKSQKKMLATHHQNDIYNSQRVPATSLRDLIVMLSVLQWSQFGWV